MDVTVVNRLLAPMVMLALLVSPSLSGESSPTRAVRKPSPTPAARGQAKASTRARPATADAVGRGERVIGAGVKPASASRRGRVVTASQAVVDEAYEGVVHEAPSEVVVDEGLAYEGGGCTSCGQGGCDGGSCGVGGMLESGWGSCGVDLCNPGVGRGRQLCICLPSHGWVQLDYLMWWQSGMNIPPLLTTQASRTDIPRTILGNEDILTDRLNGGRLRFGWWFANNPNVGIEGEYFRTGTTDFDFRRTSQGTPVLARPFFNVLTGAEDSELVSSPSNPALRGTFTADATSQLVGAAVRFRRSLCCGTGCSYSHLACGPVPTQSRIDATLGWRFLQLKEGLTLSESLTQTNPNDTFEIRDGFRTRNQFNGVELGVLWQARRGYWSLDGHMRSSIGNTRHEVIIDGSTQTNGGAAVTGGLLAQPTNIGTFTRDQFGIVTDLGAQLGYQLTPRWRLLAGYNFIYWSNVVRPGDQIDTDLNTNLIPPRANPVTGAERPRFAFVDSDYWVQGVNLGAEYRW